MEDTKENELEKNSPDSEAEKGKEKSASERERAMEAILSQTKETADEGLTLARILAVPEIRQVLDAHQKGDKIKVVGADEVPAEENREIPDSVLEGFEEDDRGMVKKLLTLVGSQVSSTVGGRFQELSDKITTLVERDDKRVSSQEAEDKATLREQLLKLAREHEDFSSYSQDILTLNENNPGLSPEELYLIAKGRKTQARGGSEREKLEETEKPSTISLRPSEKKERKEPLPPGKAGFSILLGEALESLDERLDKAPGVRGN